MLHTCYALKQSKIHVVIENCPLPHLLFNFHYSCIAIRIGSQPIRIHLTENFVLITVRLRRWFQLESLIKINKIVGAIFIPDPRAQTLQSFFHRLVVNVLISSIYESDKTEADRGEGPGGPGSPLFLDQTEARRTEKKFLRPPLLYLRV